MYDEIPLVSVFGLVSLWGNPVRNYTERRALADSACARDLAFWLLTIFPHGCGTTLAYDVHYITVNTIFYKVLQPSAPQEVFGTPVGYAAGPKRR